jgi:hypothetical protein
VLIAIGISGVVTIYGLGSMVIYNRKKRAEYYAQQQALQAAAVNEAETAISQGIASQEQQALLNKESKIIRHVEEAKKSANSPGMFARSKAWLFSGLKKEEEGDDYGTSERRLGYEATNEEDDMMGERESDIIRAIEDRKAEVQQKAKAILDKERQLQRTGGPLDRIGASNLPSEDSPKAGGWTSFMTRR